MSLNQPINPIVAQPVYNPAAPLNPQNLTQEQREQIVNQQLAMYSPLLQQMILAQNKEILKPQNTSAVGAVNETQNNLNTYKNELREKITHNKANILAVNLRTMNAQDKDGNELIQGDEVSGNFVNAIERLDEIKDLGFTTLHVLPPHPPGKSHAMGTAGSLYAPADFLSFDPELVDENPPPMAKKRIQEIYKERTGRDLVKMDKNDKEVAFAQCKYFTEECHKRGISLLLDLPSCGSVDFAKAHPEMMAVDANGKEKVPQGWQDIRMLKPFANEQTRELNKPVLDLHKQYADMAIDMGFDGIRADVGRAKPVEFWNVILNYSRAKDPNFAWLAETYTHEDASPQMNMPYDRPQELLEVGFDMYYGQYHNYADWLTSDVLFDYVKENIDMNNKIGEPKAVLGSFATHDDKSPMLYGGVPWVMFTTILQGMLPQVCPYMVDGTQTGDYQVFAYDHALVKNTETDNHECTVHTGRMDIFNKSRKPGGNFPEISKVVKAMFGGLRSNQYNEVVKDSGTKLIMNNAQEVITEGSFIKLETNNPEIIAFARHKDGKTLLFIGNRNVNFKSGATVQIPGLKPGQKFDNLMPKYGEESKFQNNNDGSVTVEMGASRACVFEIDDADIEKLAKPENVLQQQYLNKKAV